MFVQLNREYLGKPPGERIDVGDADARRLIEQGVAVAVENDPLAPMVTRAFDSALGRFSEALTRTIDQTLQQAADAQRRSRRNAAPLLFGEGGTGDVRRNFGDWLLCVRRNDHKTLADTDPLVMRDLQRLCVICRNKGQCRHELDNLSAAEHYHQFCPNAVTLDALLEERSS